MKSIVKYNFVNFKHFIFLFLVLSNIVFIILVFYVWSVLVEEFKNEWLIWTINFWIDLKMGLKPLEFSDCLLDSPYFRESIHDHEKELDQANSAIKSLIRECQNLIKSLESKTILFHMTSLNPSWSKLHW